MSSRVLAVLFVALAVASACEPPNCDRPDEGSCGNACCGLDVIVKFSTATVEQMLMKVLSDGGPDGRYRLSMTAEGSLGFYDLRPYNLSADFIGQVIHHTKVHDYNDTIDITLINVDGMTKIHAFSTSQIAGAFGDAGQNYKNIIQFINAMAVPYEENTFIGCPAPKKPEVPENLHASCRLTWNFQSGCDTVNAAIVTAIEDYTGLSNCASSEKCGYSLKVHNSSYISATHETPKAHYIDDLYMNFQSASGGMACDVYGYSTSTIWYAVLDDGTNYCNLHNLAKHTGMTFDETTNDSICTQYTSANCDKY